MFISVNMDAFPRVWLWRGHLHLCLSAWFLPSGRLLRNVSIFIRRKQKSSPFKPKRDLWPFLSLPPVNKRLFVVYLFIFWFCYKKKNLQLQKNMFRFPNWTFPRYLLQSSNKNLTSDIIFQIQQSKKLFSLNSVQPNIKTSNNINIRRAF